jgi:hypothetical protein
MHIYTHGVLSIASLNTYTPYSRATHTRGIPPLSQMRMCMCVYICIHTFHVLSAAFLRDYTLCALNWILNVLVYNALAHMYVYLNIENPDIHMFNYLARIAVTLPTALL